MQEVIDSFDSTDTEIKLIKKEIFNAIDDLKKYEKKSIAELKQEYDKLTDLVAEQLIESNTSKLGVSDTKNNNGHIMDTVNNTNT